MINHSWLPRYTDYNDIVHCTYETIEPDMSTKVAWYLNTEAANEGIHGEKINHRYKLNNFI